MSKCCNAIAIMFKFGSVDKSWPCAAVTIYLSADMTDGWFINRLPVYKLVKIIISSQHNYITNMYTALT